MHHHVGASEVEARAARHKRDEEHRYLGRAVEAVALAKAILRRAIEIAERHAAFLEFLGYRPEHLHELRKDKNLVPALYRALELLQERLKLRARRDLPQLHQHRKYLELRLRKALLAYRIARLAPRLRKRLVVFALRVLRHRTVGDFHNLVGKILRHRLLETTHDERMQLALQPRLRFLSRRTAIRDRLLEIRLERLVVAKVVRHEEVEYRPDVRDRVLDRSAGEDKTPLRIEQLHRLCVFRLPVLDVLRLVKHDGGELVPEIRVLEVALEKRVGSDYDI